MKPSTIAYYTNKGFVTPEIKDPKGRGTTRRYSCRNLVEFLMILELQKHGLSLPKVKAVLDQAKNTAPQEQFEFSTGTKFDGGFNLWDGLNFDDPIIKNSEVFIIIYDDDQNLTVKFRVLGRKKNDEELANLSREQIKNELRQFMNFRIDMDAHNSAIVINVSKLWRSVVDL